MSKRTRKINGSRSNLTNVHTKNEQEQEQDAIFDIMFKYLNAMVLIRKNMEFRPPELIYCCIEEFVLTYGIKQIGQPTPTHYRLGRPKECYRNAFELLTENLDLVYCEGYCSGLIPFMHAWVTDKEGSVIDNTLPDPETRLYFGVPFKEDYVFDVIQRRKYYGVMEAWDIGFPLLCGLDPSVFLHRY